MEIPYLVEVESTLDASAIWSDMNIAVKQRIVDWLGMQFFKCDAQQQATTTTTTQELQVLGIETIHLQYFVGECSFICSYCCLEGFEPINQLTNQLTI